MRVMKTAGLVLVAGLMAACVPMDPTPGSAPVPQGGTLDKALGVIESAFASELPAARANAIEASEGIETSRTARLVEKGLADERGVVRFAAAMAAGRRKMADVKGELVEMTKTDRDPSVRAAAIYALYRLGEEGYVAGIPALLKSKDPVVQANAVLAVGLMGEPSAVPMLQNMQKEVKDGRVRFEILAALARLGDRPAQEALASMAIISVFAAEHWAALDILGDLPAEVVSTSLLTRLKEPTPIKDGTRVETIRGQLIAARSLGKLSSAQGTSVALGYLADTEPELRALAALALGEILTTKGAGRIEPLLSDPDERVRLAAASAVVSIYGRGK